MGVHRLNFILGNACKKRKVEFKFIPLAQRAQVLTSLLPLLFRRECRFCTEGTIAFKCIYIVPVAQLDQVAFSWELFLSLVQLVPQVEADVTVLFFHIQKKTPRNHGQSVKHRSPKHKVSGLYPGLGLFPLHFYHYSHSLLLFHFFSSFKSFYTLI